MASNQTEQYGLNQWAAEDDFLRTEFNEDNRRVEAALAAKTEMAVGAYTGDSSEKGQKILVGFTPRAVIVEDVRGHRQAWCMGGLAVTGYPVRHAPNQSIIPAMEIVEGGFHVRYKGQEGQMNTVGMEYHYLALR